MSDGYSRAEIEAEHLDDFRVFLCLAWEFLGLPKPTKVQLDIAYNLQHAPRRFILQAFRGVGKSWITAAFVCWLLLLNPQLKIIIVSANQSLADDQSKFIKQLIHGMPLLQHLAPRDGQRDSAISFDVGPATPSKDPSVKSVGITGQLTGSRADVIVADDVEIPKNSYTHLLRERLAELVKEFDALLKPDGRIIYLGTPQIEGSLYNRLAQRGYSIRIWPVEIPSKLDKYQGRLAPFIVSRIERGAKTGTPVEPTRFDADDLAERRLSYGDAGYALQFMLDTTPADAERHPLKLSDLLVTDVDADVAPVKLVWGRDKPINDLASGGFDGDIYYAPVWRSDEMSKYTGTVMFIDPSGLGKDETAYAVVRSLHGTLYWVASGGFTDGFGEATLRSLAATAGLHKVNVVLCETNYGGGMFNQLLAPYLRTYGITQINPDDYDGWSKGQKELRVLDVLEPIVKSHRLVVDRKVIEDDAKVLGENQRYSVVFQFTRMARIKGALANDDRIEALAGACSYFVDRMNRDADRMLLKAKEAAMEEEIRKFLSDTDQAAYGGYVYASRRT